MTTSMAVRMPRRAVVAAAGLRGAHDEAASALAETLTALDIDTICLGPVDSAMRIASAVSETHADAVELCLCEGAAGVIIVRDLLRELIRRDRREVSIVVHRVPAAPSAPG
jgi:methylmalonyl-CoA mutase cobalamin-binding subunit